MSDPYFRSGDDGLTPLPHAHAPWGDDMLHGRLIGGLAARAIEAESVPTGWRVARLTVDLFRPAAMKPVLVAVDPPIREGRKIKVVDAHVRCDGHDVARATAVILAEGDEPEGEIWRPTPNPWPDPAAVDPPDDGDSPWQVRFVQGGFGTVERSRVWTRETACLVDDEPVTPFVRAALSGDLACPIANSSDVGVAYINADYTLLMGRYPVGEWVGLEVDHQIDDAGISMGLSTLVDEQGPFATSGGASISRPPLTT